MSTSNGYATRESMRRFERSYKDVEVPGGLKVRIQTLNNLEKEELQYAVVDANGMPNYRAAIVGQAARVFAYGVVDGEGNRMYSDDDIEFVQTEVEPDVVQLVAEEITEFAGINQSSIERLKKRFGDDHD